MKKILTIILCLCLLFSTTAMNAFASTDGGTNIMPMAENYGFANVTLKINDGIATAYVDVEGIPSKTTKIMVRMYLQQYSSNTWKTIDNWSLTKSSSSLLLKKTAEVTKGSKYRVKADITAYAGIERESITKYSSAVNY